MPTYTATPRFVQPNALLNSVNDAASGGIQNSVGGITQARNPGQLGGVYYLTQAEASARYGALAAPLFAGLYQYVQVVATSSAPARGLAACWSVLPTSYMNSLANYIVTATNTAENQSFFAGVFLNAITAGNFGWIQISGVATVQYKSGATGAIGDVISLDSTPTNTFVDLAQTATTAALGKIMIGTALQAPASAALSQVLLRGTPLNF